MPTLPQVSAAFTVNGQVPSGAVAVAGGSTVNLELVSDFGVKTCRWTVVGTHAPGVAPPEIPDGASTSFTVPVGSGQAYLIECVVNSGRDGLGRFASGLKVRALVGVVNAVGVVPFAVGEKLERSITHGWIEALNALAAAAGPAIALDAVLANGNDAGGKTIENLDEQFNNRVAATKG